MSEKDLRSVPIFKNLSQAEIERFIKSTGTTIKKYYAGERILEAFAKNANIGVIISGKAQILTLDRFGRETIGHSLDAGALFGTTSAILSEDAIGTTIQVIKNSVVMWIPYRSLLIAGPTLGHTHGVVMKNFLESISLKNVLMMQKIQLLAQRTLRERIILYAIQREKNYSDEKILIPSRVQFAKELECNRSALTRELSKMRDEGLIDFSNKWIKLNKDKIE